ncbi:DUF6478 family protein [Pseudooceanicola atlanticus]|uniref:Uncharacterized protein n=1 Tax=Pseudooceanicola atlanticus TaxID=1461694 RepID=A0A0A0EIV8_9RHOB|nr:DUF6478 family protein [Pseudooceanicola atlanticus]KGM50314.1 hypothetical protein ATO9_02120 [Pseudooceanicola atlanticus]
MLKALKPYLQSMLAQREMTFWSDRAKRARKMDLPTLRDSRNKARALKTQLDDLLYVAEGRLALPMEGLNIFPTPHGTDWSWRPELWRGPLPVKGLASVPSQSKLGEEITLFHDCNYSELSLRQLRNRREEDLAPYGLRMDVFAFDGSFLSLVINLPKDAITGLTKSHLIRVSAIVETEKPLEIFGRLNVVHGPNTEQVVRELPLNQKEVVVEFDMAYTNLNEKRVEKAWLDLIFEGPEMNQVVVRDLTFARCPRAEM